MIYYGTETHYNSLSHHGVKGMKWGVRKQRETVGVRSRLSSLNAKRHRSASRALDKDIHSFDGLENGIKTKSGKQVLSSDDVKVIRKTLENEKKKHDYKAKEYSLKAEQQARKAVERGKSKVNTLLEEAGKWNSILSRPIDEKRVTKVLPGTITEYKPTKMPRGARQ